MDSKKRKADDEGRILILIATADTEMTMAVT
jgi:hypothetical protein